MARTITTPTHTLTLTTTEYHTLDGERYGVCAGACSCLEWDDEFRVLNRDVRAGHSLNARQSVINAHKWHLARLPVE